MQFVRVLCCDDFPLTKSFPSLTFLRCWGVDADCSGDQAGPYPVKNRRALNPKIHSSRTFLQKRFNTDMSTQIPHTHSNNPHAYWQLGLSENPVSPLCMCESVPRAASLRFEKIADGRLQGIASLVSYDSKEELSKPLLYWHYKYHLKTSLVFRFQPVRAGLISWVEPYEGNMSTHNRRVVMILSLFT